MKLFSKGNIDYFYNAPETLDFSRFADQAGDFTFIERLIDYRKLDEIKGERIVHLEFEDPNRFFSGDPSFNHLAYEDRFSKVLTICPYTAAWLNKKYGNDKRTPVFFPFNETYIPPKSEKTYDIVYVGNILSPELEENARTLSKFDYRLIASTHPLSTGTIANYGEKLALIAKTRISLVHNVLFASEKHIRNLHKNAPDFRDNEAYKLIPKDTIFGKIMGKFRPRSALVPQVKSRLLDAAFCRSLILCRRDPFNLVERYFEPGKEFVYYEPGKLEEKIREILADYDSYLPVIERAYERAVKNYTTKAFFEKYLKSL